MGVSVGFHTYIHYYLEITSKLRPDDAEASSIRHSDCECGKVITSLLLVVQRPGSVSSLFLSVLEFTKVGMGLVLHTTQRDLYINSLCLRVLEDS